MVIFDFYSKIFKHQVKILMLILKEDAWIRHQRLYESCVFCVNANENKICGKTDFLWYICDFQSSF